MALVQRNARGIVLSILVLRALSRIAIGIVAKYVRQEEKAHALMLSLPKRAI